MASEEIARKRDEVLAALQRDLEAARYSPSRALAAFVVPRTGKKVDAAEILAHCVSQLVGYKCPSEVRVVGQLPVTAARKVDRKALRRACGEQELASG